MTWLSSLLLGTLCLTRFRPEPEPPTICSGQVILSIEALKLSGLTGRDCRGGPGAHYPPRLTHRGYIYPAGELSLCPKSTNRVREKSAGRTNRSSFTCCHCCPGLRLCWIVSNRKAATAGEVFLLTPSLIDRLTGRASCCGTGLASRCGRKDDSSDRGSQASGSGFPTCQFCQLWWGPTEAILAQWPDTSGNPQERICDVVYVGLSHSGHGLD